MLLVKDQRGSVATILGIGGLVLLLLASLGFAIWAFMSRADYKNNSDQKAAAAVEVALGEQKTKLEAEFLEKEKQPFETYQGPSEFGSIKISFPKTWEIYVDARTAASASNIPVDGYVHPGFVPGLQSDTAFALRFQVLNKDYNEELKTFDSYVRGNLSKVSPFRAPLVESIAGSRIDGTINSVKKGNMVVVPLRDKTLKVWTESDTYQPDFSEILKSLTFAP